MFDLWAIYWVTNSQANIHSLGTNEPVIQWKMIAIHFKWKWIVRSIKFKDRVYFLRHFNNCVSVFRYSLTIFFLFFFLFIPSISLNRFMCSNQCRSFFRNCILLFLSWSFCNNLCASNSSTRKSIGHFRWMESLWNNASNVRTCSWTAHSVSHCWLAACRSCEIIRTHTDSPGRAQKGVELVFKQQTYLKCRRHSFSPTSSRIGFYWWMIVDDLMTHKALKHFDKQIAFKWSTIQKFDREKVLMCI